MAIHKWTAVSDYFLLALTKSTVNVIARFLRNRSDPLPNLRSAVIASKARRSSTLILLTPQGNRLPRWATPSSPLRNFNDERHRERSEAIQGKRKREWIASSKPPRNDWDNRKGLLRQDLLAMTEEEKAIALTRCSSQ